MSGKSLAELIREVADPIIKAGGNPDDVNAAIWKELQVSIGRGGKGPQGTEIEPHCSYCGAYGGGGHGGLCPGPVNTDWPNGEPKNVRVAYDRERRGKG
jgi:hypothetical protein